SGLFREDALRFAELRLQAALRLLVRYHATEVHIDNQRRLTARADDLPLRFEACHSGGPSRRPTANYHSAADCLYLSPGDADRRASPAVYARSRHEPGGSADRPLSATRQLFPERPVDRAGGPGACGRRWGLVLDCARTGGVCASGN